MNQIAIGSYIAQKRRAQNLTQEQLARQKGVLYGLVLIVLGIACGAISKTTGGTDVQDFVSGILMDISVAELLAGIGIIGKQILHK